MDWTAPEFTFTEKDFSLFQYGENEATVIRRGETDKVKDFESCYFAGVR